MATILTPFDTSLAVADGELSFWKEILPESTIKYEGTRLDFNQQYFDDLICAFNDGALDQTPFMLADKDNEHTMDPERQRGVVEQICEFKDLPPEIKTEVEKEGKTSGLFGKISFPDKASASAVLKNPKLGVSARIRAGIERVDGQKFKRAIVHVLGTLDPKITGLSPWKAVSLSEHDVVVLDFSRAYYPERKGTAMRKKTAPGTKPLAEVTEAEIDAMTDEELDAFLAENGIDASDLPEGEDDEADEAGESEDENETETDTAPADKQLVGTASLSNKRKHKSDVDLAEVVHSANARANDALNRMAAAEWREQRSSLLREGVPPFMLDLAEPVLSRPNEMVVDLSNSGGEDLNVSEIITQMLEGAKGLIDMSNPVGHTGQINNSVTDEDKVILDAWEKQFSR